MRSRRGFLATGLVLALPGCGALSGPSARLEGIRLVNDAAEERAFTLAIDVDGEPVYEATHVVAAGASETPADLPDTRGRITVETAVDGTTSVTTFDDDRCYHVIAEFTDSGLVHWYSASDGCEPFRDA